MTLDVKKKEARVPQRGWVSGCTQLSAYALNPLLSQWPTCPLGKQCPELRQSQGLRHWARGFGGRVMKSRDPGFVPWDRAAWGKSKGEGVSKCLVHQGGRRRNSRAEIRETKGGQEVEQGSGEAEPVGSEEKSYEAPWSCWTISKQVVFLITFLISTCWFSE